jgi:hypothetical protein
MHRLALILLVSSACAADSGDEGFNIVNNLAPEANCALTPGGAFLSRGVIDKQSPNPYVLTPEFSSRISPTEGVDDFQRTIQLRGANVEVLNAQTGTSLGKFKSLFSASLAPTGKTTAAFDIITPAMLQASGAIGTTRVQLVAKIIPFGTLGGSGDSIDGVPYEYPVTVCDGCVATILGACPLPFGTEVGAGSPNSCNPYQDGVVSCCMGASGPICPPSIAVQQFPLTVTKAGAMAAAMTVTSTPAGITCAGAGGAGCAATFDADTLVNLAVAGGGTYRWSLTTCADNATCIVTMSSAQNVTVTSPIPTN